MDSSGGFQNSNLVSNFLVSSQKTVPNVIKLPCGLSFLKDPDLSGYYCLGFIVFGFSYGAYMLPNLVIYPMYQQGVIDVVIGSGYAFVSLMTLLSLFRAATSDPGRIPLDMRTTTAEKLNWTHCQKCFIERPVKSHHCRRCAQCIRGMDHHCPWINNCVGEDNKWIFVLLVFYGALMSFYALILIICHFYIFPKCQEDICNPGLFLFRHQRWFMYFGFILDLTLLLICSSQFFTQVINIFLNRTTLEQIIEAANYYKRAQQGQTCNHSHKSNSGDMSSAFDSFQQVWGSGTVFCWLNPLRRRRASVHFVYNEHVHALHHV